MYPHSPLPRPRETIHTPHPRSAGAGDESPLPAADNMDERDPDHLLGHEPDAPLRHRIIWYAKCEEAHVARVEVDKWMRRYL